MICSVCQTTYPVTTRFCPNCGVRVDDAASSSHLAGAAESSYVSSSTVVSNTGGPLAPGTLLNGHYQIVRVLGVGAFGRVYLTQDTQSPNNSLVAIKELLDSQFTSPVEKHEAISWFKREAAILLSLEHPSIPTIHGFWTAHGTEGPFYVAMDYIPGRNLDQVLQDSGNQIPWQQVVTWGITLCEVLSYLHNQLPPFIFRDMKLQNVMLDGNTNSLALIDFGISRQLALARGTAIGTWGYVPYEQVLGKAEPRSDIYALGATLHALLTGRRPDAEYTQLQGNGMDVEGAMRVLFPKVDTLVPGTPPVLSDTIAQATAFDSASRFTNVTAMATALQYVLANPSATSLPNSTIPTPSTAAVNVATTIGLTTKQQNTSLTVSARGGAQYKTIAAAIRHAQPGMRIEVQPGVYAERLLIDRPVEIVGLGHDVIIQTTTGSCLTMATTTATIRGVTLRGQAAIKKKQASTVDVSQGQLILEECDITSDSLECVSVHGQGASLIIQRCIVHDGKSIGIVISENAEATVEQCKLLSNTPVHIAISQNADATIRKCDFTGEQSYSSFR